MPSLSFEDDASVGEDIGSVKDDVVSKIPPKDEREADLVLGILFDG
jgi:hypothetical protein